MGILSGLEKFGFGKVSTEELKEAGKKEVVEREEVKEEPKEITHSEIEFLLAKTTRCPVCDTVFKERTIKTGRVRRLQPDFDLRPRFQDIDTNKYDVTACPRCGYAALTRNFDHISQGQIKLIRQDICSKYHPDGAADLNAPLEPYTYDEAISRYQLALLNTVAKHGKTSERAYLLLKLSWLNRGYAEELEAKGETGSEAYVTARQQENEFYIEAYDEMVKAVATENFPMCGMDESTVNILLAGMSYKLEKYDVASKLVGTVLTSKTASSAAKDRAMNLKEEILARLRGQ